MTQLNWQRCSMVRHGSNGPQADWLLSGHPVRKAANPKSIRGGRQGIDRVILEPEDAQRHTLATSSRHSGHTAAPNFHSKADMGPKKYETRTAQLIEALLFFYGDPARLSRSAVTAERGHAHLAGTATKTNGQRQPSGSATAHAGPGSRCLSRHVRADETSEGEGRGRRRDACARQLSLPRRPRYSHVRVIRPCGAMRRAAP